MRHRTRSRTPIYSSWNCINHLPLCFPIKFCREMDYRWFSYHSLSTISFSISAGYTIGSHVNQGTKAAIRWAGSDSSSSDNFKCLHHIGNSAKASWIFKLKGCFQDLYTSCWRSRKSGAACKENESSLACIAIKARPTNFSSTASAYPQCESPYSTTRCRTPDTLQETFLVEHIQHIRQMVWRGCIIWGLTVYSTGRSIV